LKVPVLPLKSMLGFPFVVTDPLNVTASVVASPRVTAPFKVVAAVTVKDEEAVAAPEKVLAPAADLKVPVLPLKSMLGFPFVVTDPLNVTASVVASPRVTAPFNVAAAVTVRDEEAVAAPEKVLVPEGVSNVPVLPLKSILGLPLVAIFPWMVIVSVAALPICMTLLKVAPPVTVNVPDKAALPVSVLVPEDVENVPEPPLMSKLGFPLVVTEPFRVTVSVVAAPRSTAPFKVVFPATVTVESVDRAPD